MSKNQHITFNGIPNGMLTFEQFIKQPVTKSLARHAVQSSDNQMGQISAFLTYWQIADLKSQVCLHGLDENDGTVDEGYINLAQSYIDESLGIIFLQLGSKRLAEMVDILTEATLQADNLS